MTQTLHRRILNVSYQLRAVWPADLHNCIKYSRDAFRRSPYMAQMNLNIELQLSRYIHLWILQWTYCDGCWTKKFYVSLAVRQ